MTRAAFETIEWTDAGVVMLDQRRLPGEEIYLTLTTPQEVAEGIRSMAIRGAPAIGVAAAMGLALGARRLADASASGSGRGPRDDAIDRRATVQKAGSGIAAGTVSAGLV